jgi:hypothetical protein
MKWGDCLPLERPCQDADGYCSRRWTAQYSGPKTGSNCVLDLDVNKDNNIKSADLMLVAKLQGAY